MLCAVAIAGALSSKAHNAEAGNGFETPVCAVGGDTLRQALADAGMRVGVATGGAALVPVEARREALEAVSMPARRARL